MIVTSLSEQQRVEADEGITLSHLAKGERMSVQYFEVAPGDTLPLHSHYHEQAGFVFNGALTFVMEDGTEEVVGAGDAYIIAGNEGHATENRGEEPADGLDVFSPPREDLDWVDDTYHELL